MLGVTRWRGGGKRALDLQSRRCINCGLSVVWSYDLGEQTSAW